LAGRRTSCAGFNIAGTGPSPKQLLIRAVGPKLGAFDLDANSKDAALLIALAPGSYTVQVKGADGGTGEGLVELHEIP